LSTGALPQTPLGELTALSHTPSWILGGLLLREGKWRKGKDRGGEERGRDGRGLPALPLHPQPLHSG